MQRMKLQITSTTLALALLTATGPVFAQEETTGTETGGETTLSETSQGGETAPPMQEMAPAGGSRLAVEFAKRPLTNGRFVLVPELNFSLTDVVGVGGSEIGVGINLGATFGVTDDLDVFAHVLPLTLAPSAGYGRMDLGGTFRFMKGNTEVGARLMLILPTASGSDFGMSVGVPILFHFGDKLRLDSGVFGNFTFASDLAFALNIPLELAIQLIPMLAAKIHTGYTLPLAPSGATDFMTIPLGFGVVLTIPGQNSQPMLDIIPTFTFTNFLQPASPGDKVNTGGWQMLVVAKFYLFI